MGGGFALIPVLIGFGLGTGLVGRKKGSSFALWFAVGFCAPGLGLIAALLYRWEIDELRRQCPGCGRVVMLSDALCTRCGTDLDWPESAIAPESALRASQ